MQRELRALLVQPLDTPQATFVITRDPRRDEPEHDGEHLGVRAPGGAPEYPDLLDRGFAGVEVAVDERALPRPQRHVPRVERIADGRGSTRERCRFCVGSREVTTLEERDEAQPATEQLERRVALALADGHDLGRLGEPLVDVVR